MRTDSEQRAPTAGTNATSKQNLEGHPRDTDGNCNILVRGFISRRARGKRSQPPNVPRNYSSAPSASPRNKKPKQKVARAISPAKINGGAPAPVPTGTTVT